MSIITSPYPISHLPDDPQLCSPDPEKWDWFELSSRWLARFGLLGFEISKEHAPDLQTAKNMLRETLLYK